MHIHHALYIDETDNKGRGVFTGEMIPAGTVIEVSPVIVMSALEKELLNKTLLHDYIFDWTPAGQQRCCMAHGYIAVYNHSPASNCEYFMNYEQETISIKTMRDINVGEELTVNYNGDWNNTEPVWFNTEE